MFNAMDLLIILRVGVIELSISLTRFRRLLCAIGTEIIRIARVALYTFMKGVRSIETFTQWNLRINHNQNVLPTTTMIDYNRITIRLLSVPQVIF